MKRNFIAEGKILKVGNYDVKILVKQWIKGNRKKNKIKVRYNFSIKNRKEANTRVHFEEGQSYLFLFGGKNKNKKRMLLRQGMRFKVQNDSLYIGSQFLNNVLTESSNLVLESNKFIDPLMPKGYKISVADFIELSKVLNESFKQSPKGCFYYNSKIEISDQFVLAIIEDLKKRYCCK